MENNTKELQDFNAFAEDKLKIHEAELNTRYQNIAPDDETLMQAKSAHQKIFEQELDEKIQSLSEQDKDEWLKTELQNKKQAFLSRLHV